MIAGSVTARRFIGRARERAFFDERLIAARGRNGSVIVLLGEAGMGKTRLAQEWMASARGLCFSTAFATNYEFATTAFAPVAEAMSALGETRPPVLASAASARLYERFISLFSDTVDGGAEPWQKRRLFVVVGSVLEQLADASPVVLVIDDAQWADPESLELLQYLASRIERSRVVVVLCARAEASVGDSPFTATLAGLERRAWYHRIELGPLSEAEMRALIAATTQAGQVLSHRAIDEICFRSEGSPLFAESLVREVLAHRDAAEVLPRSVEQSVLRRLERLSSSHVSALEVAAAIGTTFGFDLFREISGLSAGDAANVLRATRDLNLVVEETGGGLRFSHQLTRDAIYNRLLLSERRSVHTRIAESLEASGGAPDAVLAYHWTRAGESDRAADHAERAGDDALRKYAFGSARNHFESALAIGVSEAQRRAALLHQLGVAYELLGSAREAYERFGAALEIFRELGDRERVAHVSLRLAKAAFRLIDPNAAIRHGREALEASSPSEPTWFMAHSVLALYLSMLGDVAQAARHFDEAESFAGVRDRAYAVRLYMARAAEAYTMGRTAEWRSAAESSLREAEALGDPEQIAFARMNQALKARDLGDFALVDDTIGRVISLADEYGLTYFGTYGRLALAQTMFFRGDLQRALEELRTACASGVEAVTVEHFATLVGVPLALAVGDGDVIERLASPETLEAAFETGRVSIFGPLAEASAELAAQRGDAEGAERLIARVLDEAGGAETIAFDFVTLARRAGTADLARVDALLSSPRAAAPVPSVFRAVAEATLARRLGDRERTLRVARAAVEAARRIGLPLMEARALELCGEREGALAIYRRIGARCEASRLAARIGGRDGTGPALTSRESDIARLVARGKSYRHIAETLAISKRTVEHHVASAFAKLAIHSREELTAYVMEELRDATHAAGDWPPRP